MGGSAEGVCVTILLPFLVYHIEVETGKFLIPSREQTGLVLHGSEILWADASVCTLNGRYVSTS